MNDTTERDTHPRTMEGLADACIARLKDKYDLIYVDYGDELTDEQVTALVRGDWETFWDELSEFESEGRYSGVKYVIDEIVPEVIADWEREDSSDDYDADWSDLKDEFDSSDAEDRLREEIFERESGDWVKELTRGTGGVLLRVTAVDEDNAWSFEEVTPQQVLDRIGFAHTEHNVRQVQYALNNASPEFSVLLGYWVFSVDAGDLYDLGFETAEVAIPRPHLHLGNPFTGGGFMTEEPLEGTVILDRNDLRTDKDGFGYSMQEIYGGLNTRSFEVEITPAPPAPTDAPDIERAKVLLRTNECGDPAGYRPVLGERPKDASLDELLRPRPAVGWDLFGSAGWVRTDLRMRIEAGGRITPFDAPSSQ